ncbi:FKBP-type peptidyl-prolyl cis-trans isomerase [Pararcticibacter amylolyticus]|uniref:Peptidyl-prolyl cis-trans isomerase n=1 Tax=Pararcticibacter amylolyticus TaxID=2173175 RepID=A0A2U2PAL2_9SPHI|nr:FKBP-type peptidyl-prolyl cis-trans isomerase [Pararcticibacter amylolyticus]PWG78441.1 hypothetical protein DDR33_22460 [Pararcticibacter amylolyticus]
MRTMTYKVYFFVLLLAAVITGCEKSYESIETEDEKNIQAYIQKNGLNVTQYDTTGIYYQITSTPPEQADSLDYTKQLPIIYTVRSLDGAYSSQDTVLNRYGNYFGYFSPAGIRDIVKRALKKQGGEIRIIVPSRKAYGRSGNKTLGIPGNASLDYTIKVLESKKLPQYEDGMIRKYLEREGLTGFTRTESGLFYKILEQGTGSSITIDSTVTTDYTGKLLNGQVFDSRTSSVFSLTDPGLRQGWKEALPLLKEGGSIRMVFPSPLGYGITGYSGIPAFSPLDFEVKVTAVSN